MHTVKKASLFHGVFQDTITVTITDLWGPMLNQLILTFIILTITIMAGTSGKTAPAGEVENILEMNVVPFENLSTVLPEFRKYDTHRWYCCRIYS